MLGSGLFLVSGNMLIGLIMLARNILIANYISVEDYGVAMTFAITMSLIEMAFNLAADVYVVKAKNGDDPETLSVLHTVLVIRGALNGVLLYLLSPIIAGLFQAPELTWAYQTMAILSVLRGLFHLDIFRLQRHGEFRWKVIVEVSAYVLSFAAAWGFSVLWGDFRAMLGALFVQWITFMVLSHIVAKRPYRLTWNKEVFRGLFTFGWPLLLNGWLGYPVVNGDRIIVGNLLGPETLGWFSAAFMLTQTPSLLLAGAQRTLFLPQVSKADSAQAHRVSLEVALFLGLAFAIGTVIAGPALLTLLFGERYIAAVPALLWLGVMFGVRIARNGLVTNAIGAGETKVVLLATAIRVAALPLAYILLAMNGSITQLMMLLVGAEVFAFLAHLWLIRKYVNRVTAPVIVSGVVGLLTLAVIQISSPVLWQDLRFEPLQWALLLGLVVSVVFMPSLRGWITQEISNARTPTKSG